MGEESQAVFLQVSGQCRDTGGRDKWPWLLLWRILDVTRTLLVYAAPRRPFCFDESWRTVESPELRRVSLGSYNRFHVDSLLFTNTHLSN